MASIRRLLAGISTSEPLTLPAGHFGVEHSTGTHAPNDYYLIDSTNAKVAGIDGAVRSFVEDLYALLKQNGRVIPKFAPQAT